ncbi:MAG TPA: DUF5916 domain-containing protein [Longimicrobiales bacterium]
MTMLLLNTLATLALSTVLPQIAALPAPGPDRDPGFNARALRTAQAIVIDGLAGDAVWQMAPKLSGFTQFEPKDGGAPSFKTEFQVSYDDRNLYVFVRAYDPHPDSIRHALTRRDQRGPSDQIKVLIDAYHDKRTGYEFAVNPDGVMRDYSMYDDTNEDESWNGVWQVGTSVDALGWTAEFRIPLSQLRYAESPAHTFGFGVWRDIERYKERVSWPRYQRTRNGTVSQLGEVEGIDGIRSPGTLEVTPYTVTKNVQKQRAGGAFERDQQLAVGADLKYGITSNLTLNATINPDFGQVEADPAVLNLSAFETFLSERRPFFVEGTGLYQFQLNCYIVQDCNTNEGLFYSRRIGRSPHLLDDYGDESTPTATPIAGAAKLTGRSRGGFSYGVLDAITQPVHGTQSRTVEPFTNYAVLSAQQDLRGGNTGIKLIATGVNRSLDEWTRATLHENAYAGGVNFRNRFAAGKYEVNAYFAGSRVAGSREAIALTERNAVHYYQQPGDDVAVDSATTLAGSYGQLKFGKYGGGITRFETSLVRISSGYDVNDLGFLRRADILDWSTWAALSFQTQTKHYRWAQLNGNHWEHWNTSGLRLEDAFNMNGHVGLRNNWNVHLGGTLAGVGETYCDRCTRGGPALRNSRGFYPWGGINGDDRKKVVPSMWVNLGFGDDGTSHNYWLSPAVDLNLSTQLQTSLGAGIGHTIDNAQWFGNFSESGTTHYSFARLDQRTVSMNVRINYTARPNLTLEFYGEPFASSGSYRDVREVSATPRARSFAARFQPYTPPADAPSLQFDYIQLRTNAVMRWEYLPGSTVFLVWAHGRDDFRAMRQGTWRDDYNDLFQLHPDNTFLIKVAYWINR